jgi:hypothetical protein
MQGCPEPLPDKRIAPHFLYCLPVSWGRSQRLTTMRILVHGITQRDDKYIAPEAEVIILRNEISFLASGNNDDNEHTEEEDLF